ncbi:DUF58 domain-containing protein [Protaetiibacter intestinalis]|uniref:DUF58 domain-containing protein n=1 Tax=Protaetiibacter intestinalis TaxID=2419774 RepID=A0A387BBP7_9MICO|nr:DUF58 domain-containing protein [Protaetiibacter intestinalis]AYF98515.1 DUF58 domain-containing protein [Protaetiibacter intestinalis]
MTIATRLDTATALLRPAGASLRRFGTGVANVVRPAARVVWRIVGPVLRVITGAGWVVLGLGALAIVLSLVFDWQEFTFLGFVLLASVVVAAFFLVGRSSYGVLIELNPRRVVVGERAMGRMVVTNTGARRLAPTRMELPVGKGVAEFQLPAMTPKQEEEELFQVPTNRRAVIVAGPVESIRGDQLGLLRRAVKWADAVDLFVHPRTVRLASSAAGLVRDLEGQVSSKITNNDLAFHALRPYVPGDDRRYVHWRTSARIGQLMVRQFQETRRSQIIVVQPTGAQFFAGEDEFELAVSAAASIASQIIRDGTQLDVVSEAGPWRTRTVTSMLDSSSRLEYGHTGGFTTLRDLVRERTKRLPAPSVVVTVGGSKLSPGDIRSVQTLFGSDTTHLGVTAELGAQPRLGSVAGMTMLTVGRLEDLPGLFRGLSS